MAKQVVIVNHDSEMHSIFEASTHKFVMAYVSYTSGCARLKEGEPEAIMPFNKLMRTHDLQVVNDNFSVANL